MDTARKIFASLIFSVAVIAMINFIGNVLVGGGDEMAKDEAVAPVAAQIVSQPASTEAAESVAPADKTTVAAQLMVDEESAKMGASIFRKKCLGCHPILKDGGNRTGPNLFDVVNRKKAMLEGYRYSSALKLKGGFWTEGDLNSYIAGPRAMVPNTKMTFAGIKKEDQRLDVIAYLRTLKN